VGAITRSVRDAVTVHEILSDRSVTLTRQSLAGRRLGVPRDLMLDALEPAVARAFERGLQQLSRAGARIEELALPQVHELASINATGGLSAAESYAWHRTLLKTRGQDYDPRVALRIRRGAEMSAADYIDLVAARRDWIGRMVHALANLDALVSPTVPIVAPPIAELAGDDAAFFKANGLLLRNTSVVNMFDGCAISLPCHEPGDLPVGLMLWHGPMHDDTVLDIALQAEQALTAA
jgi:Asp-tRNA(Asn)/Glu-tRNA(Gln) amidotransferase A subunit family amidase